MTYSAETTSNLYCLHVDYYKSYIITQRVGVDYKPSLLENNYVVFEIPRPDFIEICNDNSINYIIQWDTTLKSLRNLNDYEAVKIFLIKRNYATIKLLQDGGYLSINLLRNVRDEIDWSIISNNNHFNLDYNFLNEFKDYLIFTTLIIRNGKYENSRSGSAVYNLKGKSYSHYSNSCLSLSKNILWNEHLLESFAEYWDWNDLSKNTHIPFTIELISKFVNRWNWEFLSANKSIYWNQELVNSFLLKLDLSTLCLNFNVDWFNVLPIIVKNPELASKIAWDVLSNNSGLDQRLVSDNYPWVFKQEYHAEHSFFHYTQSSMHKRLDVYPLRAVYMKSHDSYKEVAGAFTLNLMPSISSNTGITWTDELLSAHKDKIDFWMIALRGKISCEMVIKYASHFNVNRFTHFTYTKHSDWGTFGIYHFNSCWTNFTYNTNFLITSALLEWAKEHKVNVVSSYDPFDSPTNAKSSAEELIAESDSWNYASNILSSRPTYKFDYSLL